MVFVPLSKTRKIKQSSIDKEYKSMKKELKTTLLVLSCSALSALGAVGVYRAQMPQYDSSVQYSGTSAAADVFGQARMTPAVLSQGQVPEDFVQAAERSIDGVVNIRSEKEVHQQRFMDPFEFFFGMPSQRGGESDESSKAIGIGSGVIISEDGYIITNNHVVDGVDKLYVTTNDNVEHEATIVGTDPSTDIALVKIDAQGLHPIPFGDSDQVHVGEWVLAIGNPFNLSSTVTAGIVSAIGRGTAPDRRNSMQISSFIQTDAAVNPGSSGGALVNTRGELIGINTMIYSQTGNYAGYSFAVPVNIAAKVVADIKQFGAVQRAVLGVMGGNISTEAKEKYDLKVSEGALVGGVNDGSAAKFADIQEGDVITAINDTPIRTMSQLQQSIAIHRPGDKVEVTINRKGKELKKTVTLRNNAGTTARVEKASASAIGAAFVKVDNKTKRRLGISSGVQVAGVSDGKFRAAGIKKGFIILTINNYRVATPEDADKIIKAVVESDSDKVLFIKGIQPDGEIKYIAVDLR